MLVKLIKTTTNQLDLVLKNAYKFLIIMSISMLLWPNLLVKNVISFKIYISIKTQFLTEAVAISAMLLDSIGRKKTITISFGLFAIFSFGLNACQMSRLVTISFIICRCSIQVAIQTSFVSVAEVSRLDQ